MGGKVQNSFSINVLSLGFKKHTKGLRTEHLIIKYLRIPPVRATAEN